MGLLSKSEKKEEVDEGPYPWVLIDLSKPHWEIDSDPVRTERFFLEVQNIVPPYSVMYLEDGTYWKKFRLFLEDKCLKDKPRIPGSLRPNPKYYHLPIRYDNMKRLAEITEGYASIESGANIHVYKDDNIIIQWYYTLFDPMIVSIDIPENVIANFCHLLNTKYSKGTGEVLPRYSDD